MEVLDAPGAARAIAAAHAEVRDGERRGVHPVHEHSSRHPVPHRQPAASPLHQELPELIRVHQSRGGDRHLRQEFQTRYDRYLIIDNDGYVNDIYVSTLSGFCLQCLITDWVLSQPPRIISYMGSTSAGALVRLTWQLWGPRYSNSSEPAAVGPKTYSNLSGVLNSAPSESTIKGQF